MTATWGRRTLGDVLTVQNGYAFDSKSFGATGFPLIRIRDIKSGVTTETRYSGAFDPKYVVNPGDFLIGMDGEFGCYEWKGEPALLNQRVCRLQGFDQALEPRFLFYGINAHLKAIQDITGFTTVKHLSSKQILGIKMPIPSRNEQRRVVSILNEALEAITTAEANAERNLRNARELFECHLESLFASSFSDWPERPLEKLADIINGHAFKSTDFQRDLGVRSIKITNVGVREFVDDVGNCLPATFAQRHGDVAVAKGSIVMALTRTIIAKGLKVAVVPEHFHGALLNQRVAAVQPHAAELDTPFLFAYLSTRRVMNYVRARVNTLMQPNLSIADLKSLAVPLPSLVEQRYLVTKLTRLQHSSQKLESVYLRIIVAVNELKKSLLHQAFTGQLTSVKQTSGCLHPALRTTTSEFAANVIAFAYAQHERQKRDKTFGHVKAQKVLHLVESIAKIDLGRRPMKDAAGPNDFTHMLKAEDWAKAHNFFDMVKRGEGYEFQKLSAFDAHLANARQALAPYLPQLERVIDLLVPMDTGWAQVVTTVHAAWNNLLIDGAEVTDDAIVRAARGNWHAAKLRIQLPKFHSAIDLIRRQGIVPDGTAKYVGGQRSLL